MKTFTINIPDDVEDDVEALAKLEGLSSRELMKREVDRMMRRVSSFHRMKHEIAKARPVALRSYLDAVPAGPVPDSDRLPKE
jgi:hypothetical protein